MDELIPVEMKAKLAKRGYAYECVKCGSKFRGEKRRVRAHVYKYHLALDEVPFYCSLCHYMTENERDIARHVKGYKPHQNMVESLMAEGKSVSDSYTHRNPNPKVIGDEHMRQLSTEESQLVWLSRLRLAGAEGNTAGGPVIPEDPVDQEDLVPTDTRVEEQQVVPDNDDPLKKMPEALMEIDCVVPIISLPELDLPPLDNSQEQNILTEILNDESVQAEKEFPEEAQVAAGAGILSELLTCMQDIRTEAQQTNRLLTTLNMAIRKNTMTIDELASSVRARERQERERHIRTSPYYRAIPRSRVGTTQATRNFTPGINRDQRRRRTNMTTGNR